MPDSSGSSGLKLGAELRAALGEGDVQRVSALLDVRYEGVSDIARDPHLLELLGLIVARGADLSDLIGTDGKLGVCDLAGIGRFDGVRLLVDAGADKRPLRWTPLMEAVALGSSGDVQAALAQGPALEARDWWGHTAWMIALLGGDIAKARLLREGGVDCSARGHCGWPPLFHAIEGCRHEMLRWLLEQGQDVEQTDKFGGTPLMLAVTWDDLESVQTLLSAGADVAKDANGTALSLATSREIILRLLDAGADPADADQRVLLGLQATADEALAAITQDEFCRTVTRWFGKANPERMAVPFWEAMIRCVVSGYEAGERFGWNGSYGKPVWCAQRFGQSLTLLPDGRAVQTAGEHEDGYDPDFCIYNDVFVHESDGTFAIYGYPESVFPPTDFHTATLIGDSIYVIGSLGYHGSRRYGQTPVYRLDVPTLRMERLQATGDAPGWIYEHRAAALGPQEIRVWGGRVLTGSSDQQSSHDNHECFVLDLERLRWRRESVARPKGKNAKPAGSSSG